MILKATWYLFEVTPAIYTEKTPCCLKGLKSSILSLDMKFFVTSQQWVQILESKGISPFVQCLSYILQWLRGDN